MHSHVASHVSCGPVKVSADNSVLTNMTDVIDGEYADDYVELLVHLED